MTMYTTNVKEALEFTCERAEQAFLDENNEYVDPAPKEPRTLATDARGNQDLTDPSFVICRVETSANFENGFAYVSSWWGEVIFSPYPDTNVWNIFDAEEVKGYEKLENFFMTYCGAGAPNDLYVVGKNPQPFVYSVADINNDERINVADLVGISRIVLADNADETAKAPARAYTYAEGNISVDSFSVEAGNTVQTPVSLNSNVPVMGFQFDVELPEGFSLKGVSLDDSRGLAAHADFLDFARLENGCYRVLCASTTNTAFASQNGPALHLAVESENGLELGDYSMNISNIVLASSNEGMYPDGFAVPFRIGSATHIDLIGVDANAVVDVYDVKGVMVRSKVKAAKCLEGLPAGIYIVNGKCLLNKTDNHRN